MNHGIYGTHGRRRGWWRSGVFWLGVPGFLFLAWVWWVFPTRALNIEACQKSFEVRAFSEALEITVMDTSYRPPKWGLEIFPIGDEDRVDGEDPLWRLSRFYFPGMNEPIHYVSMRAWVPSVVYGVCWLGGVLAWWLWKGRRGRQGERAFGGARREER